MHRIPVRSLAAAVVALFLLAACGSGDDASDASPSDPATSVDADETGGGDTLPPETPPVETLLAEANAEIETISEFCSHWM